MPTGQRQTARVRSRPCNRLQCYDPRHRPGFLPYHFMFDYEFFAHGNDMGVVLRARLTGLRRIIEM